MPLIPLALAASLLAPAARADDDLDLDDLMDSIDLSDEGSAELLTYEGSADSTAPRYVPGKPVTITHQAGSIRVNCAEREGIAARISYAITGSDEAAVERMGKGIGLATWGSASAGTVKTRVPARPSSVTEARIDLIVNLPKDAAITINGGNGGVQVHGCRGRVRVRNRRGGAYVQGVFSAVDVQTGQGDVKVDIAETSEMKGQSRVVASGGDATVLLPISFAGELNARGASVEVRRHMVQGTERPDLVQGRVGDGGAASITISASGAVVIDTP